MPVWNCEASLALAIRSIIRQTYGNWELLIIDDGSEDGTLDVAREFRDPRILVQSDGLHLGLPARLNQAIELGRGAYFARMDGDDVSYPRRLERQLDYIRQHREVDLIGAWMLVFGQEGIPIGKRAGPETHSDICRNPSAGFHLGHPTYLGRTSFFREHWYRATAIRCEDQDLLLRSYRRARFANVPEILLGYREERIDLGKILTGRRYFARSLFRQFQEQGRPSLGVMAVAGQIVKAVADCIAIGTGLNYRILRHRARPITAAEQEEWTKVWMLVNAEEL